MEVISAPYDLVGRYNQDEINGFEPGLIKRFLDIAQLEEVKTVLDAMAGDGNLTFELFTYCQANSIHLPTVTVLEYSKIQSDFAREALGSYPAKIVWGDILKMESIADHARLPESYFNRVLIKSANHEIPLVRQACLYRNVYNALTPQGLFINLGFLFDDEEERGELREIARTKDTLAGLHSAAENRHFLTRTEFYEALRQAGFVDIEAAHAFTYRIRSEIVAKRYFRTEVVEQDSLAFQTSQLRAIAMRRKGRIRFEADASIMDCPGEITVARRPTSIEENQVIYRRYPYDFLRHIKAHRELLSVAANFVDQGTSVLDAGCGTGLFGERIAAIASRYVGIDLNPEFVEISRAKFGGVPGAEVVLGDINNIRLAPESFHFAVALNVLYQEGIDPRRALSVLRDALASDGTLILSAPKAAGSFALCEDRIIQDLKSDGVPDIDETIKKIRLANERLLTSKAHYWTIDEMKILLQEIGFAPIIHVNESLYYGNAWLIVVRKGTPAL